MVTGRLAGDAATDRFGAGRVSRSALAVAGVGLLVVAASPAAAVGIAGFAVMGLGVSVLFPALYLQAADTEGVPAGLGLGVMSTGARLGFLLSPPIVGGVAAWSSLRSALAGVVGIAAIAALVLEALLSRAGRPAGAAQA
jgi:MFS family permease